MGLFHTSDKARQRLVAQSTAFSGHPQTDVVLGQRKYAMTPVAWVFLAGLVIAIVAVTITLEVIPVTGLLLVAIFLVMTRPRRLLAIGPNGYSSMARSVFTGSPSRVVGRARSIQIVDHKDVIVGGEMLMLSKNEMKQLRWLATTENVVREETAPRASAVPFHVSAIAGQSRGLFPNSPQSPARRTRPVLEQPRRRKPARLVQPPDA